MMPPPPDARCDAAFRCLRLLRSLPRRDIELLTLPYALSPPFHFDTLVTFRRPSLSYAADAAADALR